MATTGGVVYHFGAYSFDEAALELRKHGLPIKLPGQPAALLRLLLRQAGQVVSREEFKDELWPRDTFVDFERGINAGARAWRRNCGAFAWLGRWTLSGILPCSAAGPAFKIGSR
jgi:DNA-binding response OmpR family regulator